MTSYALLVQAAKQDFGNGIPIMKWITSQRNSNGGFASTQDTVIGLQALSEFAVMAYSDNFDIQATITAGTFTQQILHQQAKRTCFQNCSDKPLIHVEQEIEEKSFDVTVTMVQETGRLLSSKHVLRKFKC
ncbi:CD109 antigen-like [Ruditapes philippinarum]|uniref:CD109 antigen-like n=1 Tax=Ruditapes philippinarum TaxID=129788 RepID=UPI00295B68BF|nr:CD109 antigen-like [Ruditapes philippinarum]